MAALPPAQNSDSFKAAIKSALQIQRNGLTYDALAVDVGRFVNLDLKHNMALKSQFDKALNEMVSSRQLKLSSSRYSLG
jgi:hypothetical protein